jgi:hypothetical protein
MVNRIPETRYARSGDLSIAYQILGDGPRDMGVHDVRQQLAEDQTLAADLPIPVQKPLPLDTRQRHQVPQVTGIGAATQLSASGLQVALT